MAKRLFILDGMGQIFRCYYAPFQHLNAPSGEPTRATYVFAQMLLQLIREQKPDYLAMAMDSGDEAVFRRQIDPQYKAHREPAPEDLAPQIDRILEIVRSQGVPVLHKGGFEADDLMATVCERLRGQDIEVVLVSKDKDLDQLLSERVRLFDPGKNLYIGPDELIQAKGYRPEQAIEIQTLVGDSTDNVPGVKGIGPKKAAALIAKYGSAEAVLAHADELTPAMRENIKAFADQMATTRQLVTLRRDVDFDFDLEACRFAGVNPAPLRTIFAELGFRRLLEQVGGSDEPPRPATGETPVPHQRMSASPAASAPASRPKSNTKASRRTVAEQPSLWDESAPMPSTSPSSDRSDTNTVGSADTDAYTEREDDSDRAGECVAGPPGLWTPVAARTAGRDYILVDTPAAFERFLAELQPQPRFAFDTETTHINPAWAELVGLSFSWQTGRAFYIPLRGLGRTLPADQVLPALQPILEDPAVAKVGQNIKYDLIVLTGAGVRVAGVAFDTMIASFVLDSSRRSHGMDALAADLLGIQTIPISALIGKGKEQIRFDEVDTRRAGEYAAEDADVTWKLGELFRGQLAGTRLEPLFRETEMPLVQVLADMEAEGVRLDTAVLAKMSAEIADRLAELTRDIHAAAGHAFNIDSTKQLANVLFDELDLPVVKKTKTGPSTDAETLDSLILETNHVVPRLVKEYRELTKLKGTYIDTLPTMVNPRTGRVHASFHQTVAITGRLSSSDPNLQNIPIRTEQGRAIRRAFVARDADHVLVVADYSQIELRVLAHFCKDAALRQAFSEDRDIHAFVASQVFNVPLAEVTREQRGKAKAVNFGIIYGQTAFGLSRSTGMSQVEAQGFIDMYFLRYPGIRMFIDQVIAGAKRVGTVQTILGRRRAVPDIGSHNRTVRSAAERLAVNTVIQGSAADLIKRAMIRIHQRIRTEQRPSRLLIQVHDELVFDVPRASVEAEAELIRHEMTTALPLEVPIKVDLAWADNWLDAK